LYSFILFRIGDVDRVTRRSLVPEPEGRRCGVSIRLGRRPKGDVDDKEGGMSKMSKVD
jgi:hypothetical protein